MKRKDFVKTSVAGVAGMSISGCSAGLSALKKGKSDFRTLGKTGIKLRPVGFGASRTKEPTVVKAALAKGVNLIDTGRMYANGQNEELIGRSIEGVRKDVIIQSKFYRELTEDPKAIEKSIDESLKALRTDYIDIMLKQSAVTKEELLAPAVLEALTKAKESGKIRFNGFSTHWNQAEMLREAVKSGFYDVALVAYNHAGNYTHSISKSFYEWDQAELEEEIENAVKAGMGIIAMKSCSGGPFPVKSGEKPSYTGALKKMLENTNISSCVPAMANFREIQENVAAMGVGDAL